MPKRKCTFNDDLQAKYPMFQKRDDDNYSVYCGSCKSNFSIANKGKADWIWIGLYLDTEKHQRCIRDAASSSKVSSFFVPKFTKLMTKFPLLKEL